MFTNRKFTYTYIADVAHKYTKYNTQNSLKKSVSDGLCME